MASEAHFRQTARRDLSLRVVWVRDDPSAVLEQEGYTSDMGLGGAFVETDRPPQVGAWIRLKLTSPTAWDPLVLRAQVRWVNEPRGGRAGGFGAKFDTLARSQATALYELLQAIGFAEKTG